MRIGARSFAPSWPLTWVAVAAVLAFVALGRWQWERGVDRRAQWADFAAAHEPLPADSRALDELPRFRFVSLTGSYDVERQFLLDNRTLDGRAGYEVLTPFALTDGRVVLVNRGWIAFTGYRERLPDVRFEPARRERIIGRLGSLPVAGLAQGRAAPGRADEWPKVVSFPTLAQLAAAYGRELEDAVVLLDEAAPHGFTRDWRPPGLEPARHFSYAVQWWAFAALVSGLWIVMSFRK